MMIKGLFALLMAGSLMVPLITPAMGSEGTVGLGGVREPASPRASWEGLPLPPVPHLDTMPWLNSGSAIKGPKVDILLGPKLESLGPFLAQPAISGSQFSSGMRPPEVGIATE
jgi:hypothetical protein